MLNNFSYPCCLRMTYKKCVYGTSKKPLAHLCYSLLALIDMVWNGYRIMNQLNIYKKELECTFVNSNSTYFIPLFSIFIPLNQKMHLHLL